MTEVWREGGKDRRRERANGEGEDIEKVDSKHQIWYRCLRYSSQ